MAGSPTSETSALGAHQELAILLVAAGSGSRAGGDVPKQFRSFADQPLFLYSLRTLQETRLASCTVVIVPEGWEMRALRWIQEARLQVDGVVPGGATRQESVQKGLAWLRDPDRAPIPEMRAQVRLERERAVFPRNALESTTHVLIHDAARPFVSGDSVRAVVAAVHETGAATLAVPVSDTLMRARQHSDDPAAASRSVAGQESVAHAGELVDRSGMWAIQTPQVFQRSLLERAHAAADPAAVATDDASLVLALGNEVRFVPGAWWNLKITHPEDFEKARLIAALRQIRQSDAEVPIEPEGNP